MTDSITVEAHEVEGLAEIIELRLDSTEGLPGGDRRVAVQYLQDLVDIQEELVEGESITFTTRLETLWILITEGAEGARERLGDALSGRYPEDQVPRVLREAQGLMSLGSRLGFYAGPMVYLHPQSTAEAVA